MPLTLIRFYVANRAWLADLTRPAILSRPFLFGDAAPTWFGAPPPRKQPLTGPGFLGRVREGAPVNASILTYAPHGSGTHTESVGHITREELSVQRVARPGLVPATLVTVAGGSEPALTDALSGAEAGFLEALVLRQSGGPEPFEPDALAAAARAGVRHLLVEAPSVDPESDEGRLAAHRAFWGMRPGERQGFSPRTITELIQVDPALSDGPYLLDLQVPPMETEAVSSRPILYPVLPAP